jgi:hypothetical protein
MSTARGYKSDASEPIRAMLCLGVSQTLCDEEAAGLPAIFEQVGAAFGKLESEYGLHVLASFDDDQIMVGPSAVYPWTAYILVEAPSYESIVDACSIVREVHVGPYRLWRYLRIEARIGRRLFFVDR